MNWTVFWRATSDAELLEAKDTLLEAMRERLELPERGSPSATTIRHEQTAQKSRAAEPDHFGSGPLDGTA
jgi:hypothetical protein